MRFFFSRIRLVFAGDVDGSLSPKLVIQPLPGVTVRR